MFRLIRSLLLLGTTFLAAAAAEAQSVTWPAFGPARGLLHLNGLTDVLPDFIGPIDGSAELTIFTEGNHYPVLLPLVLDKFPRWCADNGCRADPARILVVTLPQPMIVDMLMKGGIRLGNAVIPVGPGNRVYPDIVMGGDAPLKQLAEAGIVEKRSTVFARHRGLGLLVRQELAGVTDLKSFHDQADKVVLASTSESGARQQYRSTLEALVGKPATDDLFEHEVRGFPGRLGIQHRDVPYAVLNGLADGGVIFAHLAAFYAQEYPDRLRFVAIPEAARFGQTISFARTVKPAGPLTASFERFFVEEAKTAYPAGGFQPLSSP